MLNENEQIHISVVIPVYGCCASLTPLYERLKESLLKISDNFEIIMVNDASPDEAWEAISQLAKNDHRVKGINLARNFGQHYAITAGLDHSRGKWVIVMDCDLQDQPEDIVKLYNKALEGFDIVYGYDDFRGSNKRVSQLFSKLYYKLFSFLSKEDDNFNASFLILNQKVVQAIRTYREQNRQFLSLLNSVGFKRIGVKVTHQERDIGESSYSFFKKLKHAYIGITSSSTRLLRIGIILGFFSSLGSFLYGLFIIIMKITVADYSSGWSSLITSIFFVGGILMILLGILGIYLEVIFYEVKNRPVYIVSDKINF